MSQLTLDTQVCDIVTVVPKSADLFRCLRIDFCCGGKIALKDAAEDRMLNPEDVLNSIKEIEKTWGKQSETDPTSFGSKTLVAYIQRKYHDGLRDEFSLLAPYITKVARVHGENHPHLLRVQEIFKELRSELLAHTADEDANVFPLILKFLESPTPELKEKVKPYIMELEREHENAGDLLAEIRNLTNNFTPPDGACRTYRLVYTRLAQLEKDTFDHVHLENNNLFDRVRAAL
ncbi:iron-sulfur cluster repair di-iron protein [Sporosarcina sp. E16_8]|uniref:iron-sulfur cluster repair di-iron protein n=1 Tax=Sporosarcina sp. E16_8 TaxID=2789295 RepID=UPI001A91BEDE|nr:iron-sulfur cluster repair di-iron protein [Sporosarcina sp. E16_8]MBO0586761.1 iron-sulfur cluster repair di-iron protein [Sporosarcina sp. E16_8]